MEDKNKGSYIKLIKLLILKQMKKCLARDNTKINDDLGYKFEVWLRFFLPWQLRLSGSKCIALEKVFNRFAGYVRPLASKAPQEFKNFLDECMLRSKRVSKWRAPRGKRCVMQSEKNKYPNGHPRYTLLSVTDKE